MQTYTQEELDKKLEEQKIALKEKSKQWIQEKAEELAPKLIEDRALVLATEYKELSPEMKKFEDSKEMIQYYIQGGALPEDINEQKMMMIKTFGETMGLSLMECISGMAFVRGRPVVYGSVFLGLLTKNKYKIEFIIKTEEKVEVKLTGPNGSQIGKYTKGMAETAGIRKNVYLKHPIRMLSYKAIRDAQNFLCPEILGGVILAEEVNEYPEVKEIETEDQKEENLKQKQNDLKNKYKNLIPNTKKDESI